MAKEQTDIFYKLGEMHGDIKSILVEAKKTNGRVTTLEQDVVRIKLKIAYYSGGFAVVIWIIEKIMSRYV